MDNWLIHNALLAMCVNPDSSTNKVEGEVEVETEIRGVPTGVDNAPEKVESSDTDWNNLQ